MRLARGLLVAFVATLALFTRRLHAYSGRGAGAGERPKFVGRLAAR